MTRINLLPEEIRSEIDLSIKNARLKHYLLNSILIFVCIASIVFLLFFILYTEKIETEREFQVAQMQVLGQETELLKAKDFANRINLIKKIKNNNINWDNIFKELAKNTPANVTVDSFISPTASSKAKITGFALDDKSIVALKDNMNRSSVFSYVDIESIMKGADPKGQNRELRAFSISFNINGIKVK